MNIGDLLLSSLNGTINALGELLIPTMMVVFVTTLVLRWLSYKTVTFHKKFSDSFENTVKNYLDQTNHHLEKSFYITVKGLLEKTYFLSFSRQSDELKRSPQKLMSWQDRLFLVKPGCAWFVKDLSRQVQHLRYERIESQPKLLSLSKSSFSKNPAFNKLFGFLPMSSLHDVLSIMPGMFVIGGIFGTFLGIMRALPELSGMDISNAENSKLVMDSFLLRIAFSMNASALGILLSVLTSFSNTILNPERLYSEMVDSLETSLDLLWHRSHHNKLPHEIQHFDEHLDPQAALAQEFVNQNSNLYNQTHHSIHKAG